MKTERYTTNVRFRRKTEKSRTQRQRCGPFDPDAAPRVECCAKYYTRSVKQESKRKIYPYPLRKTITAQIGDKSESIATSGREAFTVKIKAHEQSQRIEKNE